MTITTEQLVAAARAQIEEVSNDQAQQLLEQGITVLDVREPSEYAAGHLPGAVNIPRGVLEFKIGSHPTLAQRDQPLLVYCQLGGRSALACQSLQQLGYNSLLNLAQGYAGYLNGGYA